MADAARTGEPGWYAHLLTSFGHAFVGAGIWVAVILASRVASSLLSAPWSPTGPSSTSGSASGCRSPTGSPGRDWGNC